MTLEQGKLLQNRYRIIEILGQGGMGAIYRAVDDNLGVEVVVKENLFTTEEYARQFRREAVILANLRHPNLPRVSNHFVIEGQGQYLIMDFIPGEDLREWMDREEIIPEADVVAIGIVLCDALGYLHSQDSVVLHRDIKPGNVRISKDGEIHLVDFGLAKIIRGDEMTTTGARAMTPGYSPPEQYGAARTDPRSDIYSLGATLYAALTGVTPEDGLARMMEQAELTPIRERNAKISRQVAAAVEKALAIYPEDRFQSAVEFKNELLKTQRKGLIKQRKLFPANDEVSQNGESIPDHHQKLDLERGIPATSESLFNVEKDQEDSQSLEGGKGNRGCWSFISLLGILIFLGVAIIHLLDPSLFPRLLGFTTFTPSTPTVTESQGSVTSEVVEILTITPTTDLTYAMTMTPSPTLTLTQTPTPTNTITLTPTLTTTSISTAKPSSSPTETPTPTATPLGGGGQIAFASMRSGIPQIWLTDIIGENQFMVTRMEDGACQPSWSPDGKRLVFISPCKENTLHYSGTNLYVINADGTGLATLPSFERGQYDPAWSPDGSKIVFTALQEDYRRQIYLLDLTSEEFVKISNGDVWDFHPDWSPDGERIVFISTRNGPSQVWEMLANGDSASRLSASRDLENMHPAWSPDGLEILFTQRLEGIPTLKYIFYEYAAVEAGALEEEIYQGQAYAPMQEGNYSTDGSWYVFESWPTADTNHDIYILPVEGGELQRVTTNPSDDFDPVWRPALP